jgi:DNA repair protein RadA/Sms
LRIDDPGCDLAVAAALASAATGTPPPPAAAFVGEVSLTGQVRAAPGMPQRLAAAKGAGIQTVFAAGSPKSEGGVRVVPVRHVTDALGWAGTGRGDRMREGREVRKM